MITLGRSQVVHLNMDNLKTTTPQYLMPYCTKKNKSQKTDNQHVINKTAYPVPLVFSVENLPFFCKLEYKMGMDKKLPIKFRLGDVQYVDELEGKH